MACTADIHGEKYLDLLRKSLSVIEKSDLLVLAGDLVLKNRVEDLDKVLSVIRGVFSGPIISCFGNEEYEENKGEYLKYREITWLDDGRKVFRVGDEEIVFVGSRGALDRPTFWQRKNIRNIYQIYRERRRKIEELLAKNITGKVVVITHYSPTYATLEGEKIKAWPEMGSKKLEETIRKYSPSLWLHGHGHRSKVLEAKINGTLVLNVSLPARGKVVNVNLEKLKPKKTLLDFLKFD